MHIYVHCVHCVIKQHYVIMNSLSHAYDCMHGPGMHCH